MTSYLKLRGRLLDGLCAVARAPRLVFEVVVAESRVQGQVGFALLPHALLQHLDVLLHALDQLGLELLCLPDPDFQALDAGRGVQAGLGVLDPRDHLLEARVVGREAGRVVFAAARKVRRDVGIRDLVLRAGDDPVCGRV